MSSSSSNSVIKVGGRLSKLSVKRNMFALSKTWTDRYFCLDTRLGKIEYYEEENVPAGIYRTLKGTLVVTKNTAIRKETNEVYGKDNCFSLTNLHDEDMKDIPSLTLHAKSDRVRFRWIEVFKRTILRIRTPRTSATSTTLSTESSLTSLQSEEPEKKEEEEEKVEQRDNGDGDDDDDDDDAPPGMDDDDDDDDSEEKQEDTVKPPTAPPLVMSKLITEEATAKDVEKLAQIAKDFTPSHQSRSRLEERAQIVRDLISAEKVYVSKLETCVSISNHLETFASDDMKRTDKKEASTQELILSGEFDNRITSDDVTAIFSHLKSLLSVEKQFLDELSRVVPENFHRDDEAMTEATASIAGIVVGFVPFLSVYVQYASNYATAVKVIERLVNLKRVQTLMQKRKSESLALTLARPLRHLIHLRTNLAKLATHTDRAHEDLSILLLALYRTIALSKDVQKMVDSDVVSIGTDMGDNDAGKLIELFSSLKSFDAVSTDDTKKSKEEKEETEKKPYDLDFSAYLPEKALHPDVMTLLKTVFPASPVYLVSSRPLSSLNNKSVTTLDLLSDGTKIRHLPNGAIQLERRCERTRITMKRGIVCRGQLRDGSKLEIHPDAITIHKLSDKSRHQYWPDNSSVHVLPDGTKMQRDADGVEIFIAVDGTLTQKSAPNKDGEFMVTEQSPDGSKTTYFPNGTVKVVDSSGKRWAQLDSDGTKIEILADLSTQLQTNPDGTQIFSSKDGTKRTVFVDGSSTTKLADGTIKTIKADGAMKTTYPDGTIVQIDADGREHIVR